MRDPGYLVVTVLVMGPALVAALLAGMIRRVVQVDVLRRHHEVGSAVFLQLGVVFAVLLAFVFSEVWTDYNSAASSMDQESSALNGAVMLSTGLAPEARQHMKRLLGDYTTAVLQREFPEMRERRVSQQAEDAFQALWVGTVALPIANPRDATIREQILPLLSQAHQNRDVRLFQMDRSVPGLIWVLLLTFGFVLVGFLLFFGLEYVGSQMLFTGAFAGLLAFVMIVVQLLDFPFEGVLHLPPSNYQETLQKIVSLPG